MTFWRLSGYVLFAANMWLVGFATGASELAVWHRAITCVLFCAFSIDVAARLHRSYGE